MEGIYTEEISESQHFCPFARQNCLANCALYKDGQCAIYLIYYELSLLKGSL